MDNNFKTFVFRDIRQDEVDQAFEIELLCFPPNEACTREMFAERINLVPDLFLVAEDTNTGMIAGFLTGIATNEHSFRDEFFGHASLNDPSGETHRHIL